MISDKLSENRFLIVDAVPFGRDTLRRLLLAMGVHYVDIAVTANSAIDRCSKNHYDFVIADYDLGEGKNGLQLLEELRTRQSLKNASAFMMLSAATDREVVLSTLEFRPDDYVAKPYQQPVLIKRVVRLLRYKHGLHRVFRAIDDGQWDRAIKSAEQYCLSQAEFVGHAQRVLGDLYLKTGQPQLAEQLYRRELEKNDSDWAKLGLANAQMAMERFQVAESLYRELIDSNALYVDAYEQLARICLANEEFDQAETLMSRAVQMSPLSVHQQSQYAEIASINNHFAIAADAWRNAIKNSRNSINASGQQHLRLAQALTDYCEMSRDARQPQLLAESLGNLAIVRKQFHAEGDEKLQSLLIESRTHLQAGNGESAQHSFDQASQLYHQRPHFYDDASRLELAKCYVAQGEEERAQALLIELVDNCDDKRILSQADKVLEEPVTPAGKLKIIEINRDGINAYKAKSFREAVRIFDRAQKLYPKSLQLNLNLVQSLIQALQQVSDRQRLRTMLARAREALHLLRDMEPSHAKYRKYQRLGMEVDMLYQQLAEGQYSLEG